jgi:O-antigen/teichoic acid export membrane protein
MSTVNRLLSGSAASWIRLIVTVVSQLALVPLYLSKWTIETYGVWIAIQALVGIISVLDIGHQTFLGYEFLKIGKEHLQELSLFLWSGVGMGVVIGIVQLLIIIGLISFDVLSVLFGDSGLIQQGILKEAAKVLLIQGAVWFVFGSVGGILVRVMDTLGYFPRMAWWGVFASLLTSTAPAIAVVNGAGLLMTGIVAAAATVSFNIPLYIDLFRILRKEKLTFVFPSFKTGLINFKQSLILSGKGLLDNFRNQGVRLLLSPLSGAAGLAAFTTMRTGANAAMQGLSTIINPLMPELMRFLNHKDQARSEAAFGTVWIVVIVIMAPAVIVLQVFIEPIFSLWTHGQIKYDPQLFAVLSLSVLINATLQPAVSVVVGNNLLGAQFAIAILIAAIVIFTTYLLVPFCGILGAGISLLIAEIVAAQAYTVVARKCLKERSLEWPEKLFNKAVTSVMITSITVGAAIILPQQFKYPLVIVGIILLILNMIEYWKVLPDFATHRAKTLLFALPGIGRYIHKASKYRHSVF